MIFGGDAFVDYIGELSLMKDLTKTMDITMRQQEEEAAAAEAEAEAAAAVAAAEESGSKTETHATATSDTKPETAHAAYVPPVAETLQPELPIRPGKSVSPSPSGTSTPRPGGIPTRLAIEHKDSDEELTASEAAAGMTEEEKRLREKQKKKGGLTKEQREELLAYELERKKARDERVQLLTRKLIDRLSLWTETDK